tara:strand:- start:2181 stop:2942 length:762 start_codon:yes stop_codon:yes gene_type:complete
MEVVFDRGDITKPKGHALVYFKDSGNSSSVWVTYIVILPIKVDVSKYVPPFLMNQVGGEFAGEQLSSFAFPPAPEQMGNYKEIEDLAMMRDDDILFGGTLAPADVSSSMSLVNQVVERYASAYAESDSIVDHQSEQLPEEGIGVSEVLYGLMSDSDKLGELTRLTGRLRFSVDGSDDSLINDAEEEIKLLSGYLPDSLNIPRLVQTVKSKDGRSEELADLYLQRCYHLVQEEYSKLIQVEDRIKGIEHETSGK